MSKSANAGELNVPVDFIEIQRMTDQDGYPDEIPVNVFGGSVRVKWVNAHGTETFTAMQLQIKEPATITVRYSPKINETLLVYRRGDNRPYEIISIDNVGERNAWLEIKVRRKMVAR